MPTRKSRPTFKAAHDDTSGVLKLISRGDSYSGEFGPVEPGAFTDGGSASCRRRYNPCRIATHRSQAGGKRMRCMGGRR